MLVDLVLTMGHMTEIHHIHLAVLVGNQEVEVVIAVVIAVVLVLVVVTEDMQIKEEMMIILDHLGQLEGRHVMVVVHMTLLIALVLMIMLHHLHLVVHLMTLKSRRKIKN